MTTMGSSLGKQFLEEGISLAQLLVSGSPLRCSLKSMLGPGVGFQIYQGHDGKRMLAFGEHKGVFPLLKKGTIPYSSN